MQHLRILCILGNFCFFYESFFTIVYFSKCKSEVDKKQVLKDLGKVAKYAKNALINHDAYLQADAEAKNYKLAKYRAKIQAAASDSEASEQEEGKE